MANIERYVIVDENDQEDDYTYNTFAEAHAAAATRGRCAIIARIYEYTDTELVWTSTGADVWPPVSAEQAR